MLQRAGAIATVFTAWSLGTLPTLAVSDESKISPETASNKVPTPVEEAANGEEEFEVTEVASVAEENISEKDTEKSTEKHSAKHGKKAHKSHKE
jgi:hypothetical protein